MNKNYLRFLWKKSKLPVCFFAVLYLGIILIQIGSSGFNVTVMADELLYNGNFAGIMTWNLTLSTIACFVLPLILFSFVHRRKSADMYFALPVKRSEMLITTLVFSIGTAWIVFTLSTLLCVMFSHGSIPFVNGLGMICVALIAIAALQMFNAMTYLFANNIFDGIVMTGAYSFMPLLLYFVNTMISQALIIGYEEGFPVVNETAKYLSPVVLFYREILNLCRGGVNFRWQSVLVLAVFIVVCGYLLYVHFVRRKTERADHLSDELMAYPLVIHVYLLGCLMIFGSSIVQMGLQKEYVLYLIGLLAIYIVSQSVYRRKVEVTLRHLVVYGVSLVCALAVGWGIWMTHGFGLADRNPVEGSKRVSYVYNVPVNITDDGKLIVLDDDTENRYFLQFDVRMSEKDIKEHPEAVRVLEEYRKNCVNHYYERTLDPLGWNGSFMIQDQKKANEIKSYSYQIGELMSMEDLLIVDAYSRVTIEDVYSTKSIPLKDFVK